MCMLRNLVSSLGDANHVHASMCRFAASDASVVNQFNSVDAFGQFLSAAQRISEQHESMHAADIASMYIALVKFVGAVYPDQLDSVDRVLQSCCTVRPHTPAICSGWELPMSLAASGKEHWLMCK